MVGKRLLTKHEDLRFHAQRMRAQAPQSSFVLDRLQLIRHVPRSDRAKTLERQLPILVVGTYNVTQIQTTDTALGHASACHSRGHQPAPAHSQCAVTA
jgi:hypothetical protein